MSTVALPINRVYVNTGIPIAEKNLIEFRQIYEGLLLPSGNNGHPEEKHAIRKLFHPQLRRLWRETTNLRTLAIRNYLESISGEQNASLQIRGYLNESDPRYNEEIKERQFRLGIAAMGKKWSKSGFDLVPLVTPELALRCSIEMLILRPAKTEIFRQGDLDGQVRTLLDALRIPDSTKETGGAEPEEDEKPLFALLQNDSLISEVKVSSDQLLMLPEKRGDLNAHQDSIAQISLMLDSSESKFAFDQNQRTALDVARSVLRVRGDVRPNDAFVLIHVRLNHKDPRTYDNYFGGMN